MSNKLLQSYEKQKSIFEESKERKKSNMTKQANQIDKKIQSLQEHREKLVKDFYNIEAKEFMSFEQYQSKSIVQSCIQREDYSPDLSDIPESMQDEVLKLLKSEKYDPSSPKTE